MCTVSLAKPNQASIAVGLYEWFHRMLPDWVDCRPIPAGEFLDAAGMNVLCRRAGSMWGLPVEMILSVKSTQGTTH